MSVALESWCRGWKPRSNVPVTEWGKQHVKIPHSARSSSFDPEQSYWLKQPLNRFPDNSIPEIVLLGPPGSSKTTFFEVAIPYLIVEDPGPTQISFHTDPDAEDWLKTRGKPLLRSCPPVLEIWPADKNKDKKDEIVFDHMPMWINGANLSSLQVKSCRYVFGDEVWRWKAGMIREARARTHDRWNSRCVWVSQGGEEKTEFHELWKSSTQHEAHFTCPQCVRLQPWLWNQIRYDEQRDQDGILDYQATGKTARYVCVNEDCKTEIKDEIQARRHLASNLQYIAKNPNAKIEGYHYNAMAVWWISWQKLVIEWLLANEAKRKGDMGPLKKFKQKRLAEFWSEEFTISRSPLKTGGYRKQDFSEGQLWEGELYRFLTIDKQLDHFWVTIRAWKPDGSSRSIYESRMLTEESIRDLQIRYRVPDKMTFMDARYKPTDVYAACAKFGWTAVFGTGEKLFTHYPKKGRPFSRYFSPLKSVNTGTGSCNYLLFSNEGIKDILANLRGGHGAPWDVPDDISEEYLKQIDSEVKREIVNKRTNEITMTWVKVRENHLWDCEVMQVMAANIFRLIGHVEAPEPDPAMPQPSVDTNGE